MARESRDIILPRKAGDIFLFGIGVQTSKIGHRGMQHQMQTLRLGYGTCQAKPSLVVGAWKPSKMATRWAFRATFVHCAPRRPLGALCAIGVRD